MPSQRPRLLVVDDDRSFLAQIGTIAQEEGFEVATTAHIEEARAHLHQRPAELVLVDLCAPGVKGLASREVRDMQVRSRVAVVSAHPTPQNAVDAVKHGAVDYLPKPLDAQRTRALLASVRAQADARRAVLSLEWEVAQRLEFCGMVGRGPSMQEAFGLIRRLAPHTRIALVSGEPGTGKELAARALHQLGGRSTGPFVVVTCSAAVEPLLETELFGQVRDGIARRPGVFETAAGGTIMLDEVSELTPALQARLSTALASTDVHLIATTSHDLRRAVAGGRFRSDLYRQLSVGEVHLPALRHRREDIPYLTASMVRMFAQRFEKSIAGLTPAAEGCLAGASWPGNVRQLRNVLERACVLADGEFITDVVLAAVMEPPPRRPDVTSPVRGASSRAHDSASSTALLDVQRDHIVRTLERVKGNKAVAARLLGLSRRAFYRQLERHGLHTRVAAGATSTASSLQGQHS